MLGSQGQQFEQVSRLAQPPFFFRDGAPTNQHTKPAQEEDTQALYFTRYNLVPGIYGAPFPLSTCRNLCKAPFVQVFEGRSSSSTSVE